MANIDEVMAKYKASGYQMSVSKIKSDSTTQTEDPLEKESKQKEEIAIIDEKENTNLGTGFNPTIESKPEDSIFTSTLKTAVNIPKSIFNLGKDIFTAVTNPIDTTKSVVSLLKGTGGKLGETVLEKTDFGKAIAEKINDYRIEEGLEPFPRDENGTLQLPNTQDMEIANMVGAYFQDRYGSVENFKESAVEDPAGVVSDIAALVTGTGTLMKQSGNISRISRLSKIGSEVSKIGSALEPTNVVSTISSKLGTSLPARIVSEASPNATRFAEGQVAKALELTPSDLSKITQSTGNDVVKFISDNNLLKETPEAIVKATNELKTNQYNLVREEIGKVTTTYKASEVPRVKNALESISEVVDGVVGLEDTATEVNKLLNQDNYTLSDIQRVKEILDNNSNIYNRVGDTKQSATARGLDNVRKDLRSFIENEVTRATEGTTNIRQLNNDVATTKEIIDAIELRETRPLTRQYSSVFDGMLGLTAGATISPEIGVAVFVGKKLSETPSFRIALARVLKAKPIEEVSKWADEMVTGNLSPETKQGISNLIEEAKANAELVEAGAQMIEETNKAFEQQQ